ncbi:MAG: alpha/beta fold hydrolase [Candidatus Nanosyncoccus sp.]
MKTLYIIHGWTYTVEPWNRTIKILNDKYQIKVEMLHVPGLTDPSKKVWTIDEYVKWADSLLPEDAIVLGHSNGGRILLNLLSRQPDRVSHLILLDAAGIYEPSKKRDILRKLSQILAPLRRVKILRKIIHKMIGAGDYDKAPENMKKTLTNMLDSDRNLDISKVKVKTDILWGEMDKITPPRQAKKMHQLIKKSRLKLFPNWTHAPYIVDPEGLAKAISIIMGVK